MCILSLQASACDCHVLDVGSIPLQLTQLVFLLCDIDRDPITSA
jgi:hypothetical protein